MAYGVNIDPRMLQDYANRMRQKPQTPQAPKYSMGLMPKTPQAPQMPASDKMGPIGGNTIPPWMRGGNSMPLPNTQPTPNNGGQLPPWLTNGNQRGMPWMGGGGNLRTFADGGIVGNFDIPSWVFGGGQAPQQQYGGWWPGVWGGQSWPFMQGGLGQAEQALQRPKYSRTMFENVTPGKEVANPNMNMKQWENIWSGNSRMNPADISYMNRMVGRLPMGKSSGWTDIISNLKSGEQAYDPSNFKQKFLYDWVTNYMSGKYPKVGFGGQGDGGYGGGDMGPGGYGGDAGDRASGE